jgi:hypothetical protein
MSNTLCTLPGWPRGMREELAAAYVGLSESGLRAEVKSGAMAAPIYLTPGRIVYLRDNLDAYLDAKAGKAPAGDGSEWLRA